MRKNHFKLRESFFFLAWSFNFLYVCSCMIKNNKIYKWSQWRHFRNQYNGFHYVIVMPVCNCLTSTLQITQNGIWADEMDLWNHRKLLLFWTAQNPNKIARRICSILRDCYWWISMTDRKIKTKIEREKGKHITVIQFLLMSMIIMFQNQKMTI